MAHVELLRVLLSYKCQTYMWIYERHICQTYMWVIYEKAIKVLNLLQHYQKFTKQFAIYIKFMYLDFLRTTRYLTLTINSYPETWFGNNALRQSGIFHKRLFNIHNVLCIYYFFLSQFYNPDCYLKDPVYHFIPFQYAYGDSQSGLSESFS